MVLNGCDNALGANPHFLGGSLNNANVGLMWNNPVDFIGNNMGFFHGRFGGLGQLFHSVPEHFFAVHSQMSRRLMRNTAIDVKNIAVRAIRVQIHSKHAAIAFIAFAICGLKNQRACAIAK